MSLVINEESPLFKMNDFIYMKNKIEEDDDVQKGDAQRNTVAAHVRRYFIQNNINILIEVSNALFSFMLALTFMIGTYYDDMNPRDPQQQPEWLRLGEIILIFILASDWLINFYISENRIIYIFSVQSFMTYMSLIPTSLIAFKVITENNEIIDITYMKLLRMTRLFSIFRLNSVIQSQMIRVTFKVALTFIIIIFLFAACMLAIENIAFYQTMRQEIKDREDPSYEPNEDNLENMTIYGYHDMLYYIVVTMTVVGFGDISPQTPEGQMLYIIIMFTFFVNLEAQVNELQKAFSLTSEFSRFQYQKANQNTKHILLLGESQPDAVRTFLKECFHSDHGVNETEVVIMRNAMPSEEMTVLLNNEKYQQRVHYVQGSPLNKEDLERCLAHQAACAIIMSNKFCSNHKHEDYKNILSAFAIKKYVKQKYPEIKREQRICLQIAKPEHKDLYYSGLVQRNTDEEKDQVLCVEELKLQLLAKSAVCPGIITIIWSLITSDIGDSNDPDEESEPDDDITVQLNIPDIGVHIQQNLNEKKGIGAQGRGKQSRIDSNLKIGQDGGLTNQMDQNKYAANQLKIMEILKKGSVWMHNYQSGTKYELYQVPLKRSQFEGLKFKNVCMILYQKQGLFLIALEIRIAGKTKVFVNPYDYVFDSCDHYGYVIHSQQPSYGFINEIDLRKSQARNFFIMDHLNKQDTHLTRREMIDINLKLAREFEKEDKRDKDSDLENNFFVNSKPGTLQGPNGALQKNKLKGIQDHIIVCGIVKGIKNLILPLRSRFQTGPKKPIVILSNDNLGDENMNGFTFIWNELMRFEDIYLIRGSALQQGDLEKAQVKKASAVIILSKSYESSSSSFMHNSLDADAIFMYKTIDAQAKNPIIVTELATINAIAFIEQDKGDSFQQNDYYSSKPFAAGEIFISHLLDSLMCQAFYNPGITEILEQMIMGQANTSPEIMVWYRYLNLSICSLNLISIPDACAAVHFIDVFEYCVTHKNMIPIAIYRRHNDESSSGGAGSSMNQQKDDKADGGGVGLGVGRGEERPQKKSYVWLHPPKKIEVGLQDQLFVLCEKTEKESMQDANRGKGEGAGNQATNEKGLNNEGKKIQNENMNMMHQLNDCLKDLEYSTSELLDNVEKSGALLKTDIGYKIKSGLEAM